MVKWFYAAVISTEQKQIPKVFVQWLTEFGQLKVEMRDAYS